MRIKTYNQFTNEELGWKDALIGAAIGLSPVMTNQAKSQVPTTQQQSVLARVNFSRSESVSNPDLDLVHGALGSKRLKEDFEQKVQDELTKQISAGKKPDVSNIKVTTYVKNGLVITEATCDIMESTDGTAYSHFTTRGSIGDDYDVRHDKQIDGLIDRLEKNYGGKAKQVGKTFNITFILNGQAITYRQSFFIASDQEVNDETRTITAKTSDELRQKLKNETQGQMIDLNSVDIDFNKMKVTYNTGTTKVMNLSLVVDNKGDLEKRLGDIQQKNPTMKVIKKGFDQGLQWSLLAF
jgi:hypothetical protein